MHEPADRSRVGRILTILGDLLHEAGELVHVAPAEADGASVERSVPSTAPASGTPSPAPATAQSAVADAAAPSAQPAGAPPEELYLVCDGPHGDVAFPWRWVAGTHLAENGAVLGFRIIDARGERELTLGRVLGLWKWGELVARGASVHHFFRPEELITRLAPGAPATAPPEPEPTVATAAPGAPAAPAAPQPSPRAIAIHVRPASPPMPAGAAPATEAKAEVPRAGAKPAAPGGVTRVAQDREPIAWSPSAPAVGPSGEPAPAAPPAPARPAAIPPPATPAAAVLSHPSAAADERPAAQADEARTPAPPAIPEQVCIISPSALARRFLMRHLCELGYEVLEARDLDDPLLPADLRGVTALFLDESLEDDWTSRPAAARGDIPIVLLTVDGELRVPLNGDLPLLKAVLPRPFERAEVERVVRWLRSLREGGAGEGSGDHGNAEDDTWLFADPFGPARAGEHSRR
jgi:hypothetical protein